MVVFRSRYVKNNFGKIFQLLQTYFLTLVRFWSKVNLNLMRHKHKYIITHWTKKHRKWDESNAWDTFFRLSTIYRICNRLNLREKDLFHINNFPGIG